MSIARTHLSLLARPALCLGLIGAALLPACVDEEPGIDDPSQAGSAGSPAGGSGGKGNVSTAGSMAAEDGGEPAGIGGTGDAMGGSANPQNGGTAGATDDPVAGGSAGEGNIDSGVQIPPPCPFHTPAPTPSGEGGAGGGAPAPNVTLQVSPFVGPYLADGTGRTLYTYGADRAGDCNTPPVSGCTADCLVSWPPFDAGARVLPPELADAGFGTIERPEGGQQTTYMGWPLYYYKSDLTLGQLTGQGKGKIWHVAELVLPSVTIMKAGALKYLADAAGRTLYVSDADQVGTVDADPVSNCSGSCREIFEGFREKKLSLVSVLEPLDFSVFVRHATGGLQVAYKGKPLYRAATDLKSGDTNGTAVAGFTLAEP